MHGGCNGRSGLNGCSLGQSGNFGGSHDMISQSFENSQTSVFGLTLKAHMGMKEKRL
jgi:hypothetical protein